MPDLVSNRFNGLKHLCVLPLPPLKLPGGNP